MKRCSDGPMTHFVKCWPEPFFMVMRGLKTAEFRKNDRDYRVGDILQMAEWNPATNEYTHRNVNVFITDVRRGSSDPSLGFGIPEGYAMLSIQRMED